MGIPLDLHASIIEDYQILTRRVDRPCVLINGVFDILHPGHLLKFQDAKRRGACLVVSVDSDEAVEDAKGRPPLVPWEDRAAIVASLSTVDYVIEHTNLDYLISVLKPEIWAARSEDEPLPQEEINAAREAGTWIVRIPRFGSWSSTRIREALRA